MQITSLIERINPCYLHLYRGLLVVAASIQSLVSHSGAPMLTRDCLKSGLNIPGWNTPEDFGRTVLVYGNGGSATSINV